MTDLIDRLLAAWTTPLPHAPEEAHARFAALYADPVAVNGHQLRIADLVARARAMQAALSELELVLADLVVRDGVIAATIRQRGRHTGVLAGPLGELAPTGKTFDVLSIDVLHVRDDRITAVWVVADELGRLLQLGALGPTGMNEATKVPSGIEPE